MPKPCWKLSQHSLCTFSKSDGIMLLVHFPFAFAISSPTAQLKQHNLNERRRKAWKYFAVITFRISQITLNVSDRSSMSHFPVVFAPFMPSLQSMFWRDFWQHSWTVAWHRVWKLWSNLNGIFPKVLQDFDDNFCPSLQHRSRTASTSTTDKKSQIFISFTSVVIKSFLKLWRFN